MRLTGGQLTGEFSSLVRPAARSRPTSPTLTGITDDMVGRAPLAAAALRAFLAFASDCVLVAHNAPFDLGFLTAACAGCRIGWPPAAVLDTAVLARLLLGPEDVPDCRLARWPTISAPGPRRATGRWPTPRRRRTCWPGCSAWPPAQPAGAPAARLDAAAAS